MGRGTLLVDGSLGRSGALSDSGSSHSISMALALDIGLLCVNGTLQQDGSLCSNDAFIAIGSLQQWVAFISLGSLSHSGALTVQDSLCHYWCSLSYWFIRPLWNSR